MPNNAMTRQERAQRERTKISFKAAAMVYVDKQLATMEKYGSAPELSLGEYLSLVDEMQAIGEKMWTRTGGKIVE